MHPQLIYFLQIILAAFLGGVIGWQRKRMGVSAGPRTYGLVSLGAALFTIMSVNFFGLDNPPYVAAQIVTGVGFLGAGAIMRRANHVEGLTTAAGFWVAAGLGMAVGAGFYILAASATLLILTLLVMDDNFVAKEEKQGGRGKKKKIKI